jgi:hypothetical protein
MEAAENQPFKQKNTYVGAHHTIFAMGPLVSSYGTV